MAKKLNQEVKLYADSYSGAGMTAEEIWEECICDFLGDINIFSKSANGSLVVKELINQTQAITKEQKAEPNQTRGSPEATQPDGKASRESNIRYSLSEAEYKQKQLEIIQETNPMWDDYHTGIRTTNDIRTWEEVLELNDESEGQFVWGDFSRADAERALKDGIITVYSSYPIKNGVFVSTSFVQAQEYAGGKNSKVYSKTVPLTDVAWINGDEGQYALVKDNNTRYSRELEGRSGEKIYTYNELINKNDLPIVVLPTKIPLMQNGKIDKKEIIAQGRINAKQQNNPNNTVTETYVRVDDIELDILLSKNALEHGIPRSEETALAVMKIGDILKNSVAVNELNGSDDRKTKMSYVLLGACKDNNNFYVVRSVVSKMKNEVTAIDIYQLGAVKSKKIEPPTSTQGGTAVREVNSLISSGVLNISIADFLEYVKNIPIANEIFSEDVAKNLGITRTQGTLSQSVRYSRELDALDYITPDEELEAVDETAFSNRTLLANALLDTITSSEEYKLVRSYQEEIAKLDAGDKRLAQLKKDLNQLYKQEKPNLEVIRELSGKINELER